MTILIDTAQQVKNKLASEYNAITIERTAVGVFFSGVKETDALLDVLAAGGSGYHFFDRLAPRMVIEKPS